MSSGECWAALRRLRQTFPDFSFRPSQSHDGTWDILCNALKVFGFGHGARLRSVAEVDDYVMRYTERLAKA